MLFLIPIVAGAAAWLTRDQSGSFSAREGARRINCYQIWDQITHGAGPSSISDGQHAATRLKASYQDRLTALDRLSREMDAAWKGAGATAAQNSGAHPLRVWMEDSAKKLADSDKYLGEQHSAFSTVAAKVQQVPERPPRNNFLNSITPWETDTDRAIKDYNRNGQANVDAFNAYFKASSDNGKGLPAYSAVEGSLQNVTVTDDAKHGKGKGGDGKGSGKSDPGNHAHPPRGVSGTGNLPGSGGNLPGGDGYRPDQVPGGGHPPSDIPGYRPGQATGGGGHPPTIPGWAGTKAAGYTTPQIPGSELPGSGSGGGGLGGGGGAGFGPGGAGAGGFSPGTSGFGPGTASGVAIPGSGRGAGSGGGGGGSDGSSAGANRPGMSGMGAIGHGAKGGKGGDEEHSAKYLVSDDPNDLFGTDELTAPPVIGE